MQVAPQEAGMRKGADMADTVRKVSYCSTMVTSRAGQGAKVLAELKNAGVNLTAFTGFPTTGGRAQLDFIAENMTGVRRAARKNGWRLSGTKKGFLIQGKDQVVPSRNTSRSSRTTGSASRPPMRSAPATAVTA
jgi:hypothetical protein